jgi:hypothetical protein
MNKVRKTLSELDCWIHANAWVIPGIIEEDYANEGTGAKPVAVCNAALQKALAVHSKRNERLKAPRSRAARNLLYVR